MIWHNHWFTQHRDVEASIILRYVNRLCSLFFHVVREKEQIFWTDLFPDKCLLSCHSFQYKIVLSLLGVFPLELETRLVHEFLAQKSYQGTTFEVCFQSFALTEHVSKVWSWCPWSYWSLPLRKIVMMLPESIFLTVTTITIEIPSKGNRFQFTFHFKVHRTYKEFIANEE